MDIAERETIDAEVIEVQTARAARYDDLEEMIKRYTKAIGTVHQVNLQTDVGAIATRGEGIIAEGEIELARLIEELKIEQAGI